MSFHTRNSYYLRISASAVLPLYVYLDDRHVSWMSDRVLQYVLADLKPKIIPKMRAEAGVTPGAGASSNAKKGSVDVHRGETYQFAYFFRQTEPHAVLIKVCVIIWHTHGLLNSGLSFQRRNFVLDTRPPPPAPTPRTDVVAESGNSRRRRSAATPKATGSAAGKKRKTQAKKRATQEEDRTSGDDEANAGPTSITPAPRRSSRAKKPVAGNYAEDDGEDIEMADGDADDAFEIDKDPLFDSTLAEDPPHQVQDASNQYPSTGDTVKGEIEEPRLDLETSAEGTAPVQPTIIEIEEDEEPKPKLSLQLKYQGFSISGRCLCVVVEPWPPQRAASRAPSLAPSSTTVRAPSIAPADFVPSGGAAQRARTPLFLPDDDDREGNEALRARTLPPVPLFDDPVPAQSEWEYDMEAMYGENAELLQFSQIISATGGIGAGAEDDDEFEGAVFFADADEAREL
ncbi:hypothetical protein FA95DRAFT_1579688 [Auriscalpium vulgare]|uniref:Uncharacterized protein n=1 Tax=Auriscalpium vulgare TaxID=40419 RepID=A0ACB8S9C3_9AGAM|nr:hypothetical protein FA95DRAFT_1579688 [Auriscalpium vulgare]